MKNADGKFRSAAGCLPSCYQRVLGAWLVMDLVLVKTFVVGP